MSAADLPQLLLDGLKQAGPLGLRQAALSALAASRNLDAPGALAVLEGDPGLGEMLARTAAAGAEQAEELAAGLAARLGELARAPTCLGCATCCRASSPTLYDRDLELVHGSGLTRADLVTLRVGERAFSARLERSLVLDQELIKLRWLAGGACAFLQANRCGIYEQRPLQCRQLECWSGRHAGQLAGLPRLTRSQIYADDATALALIAEYESKLPAAQITQALEAVALGGDQAPALGMMELDHRLRAGIHARYGYAPQELGLLLGRPARELARGWGLDLAADSQGRPCLASLPSPA